MPEPVQLLIDHPLPGVCRLTLKRPEERNALNNRSRAEIFAAPEHNDRDTDLRLTVLRGARGRAAAGAGRHQPAQRAPGYLIGNVPQHGSRHEPVTP